MRAFLLVAFSVFIFSCRDLNHKNNVDLSKVAKDTANFTTVQWTDSVHDLGALNFGETVQIKFHFKNTGNKPLYVISAMPGCGCTVADYPKEAISPGKEGVVVASFDTNKGHPGPFNKGITVVTNTKPNGNTMLTFVGVVNKKDGGEEEKKPEATDTLRSE